MNKNVKVKQIEDVVVEVHISEKGEKDTICYHLPQGMNGEKFSAFKTKYKAVIKSLKSKDDGSEEEITEFKPIPPNTLFSK